MRLTKKDLSFILETLDMWEIDHISYNENAVNAEDDKKVLEKLRAKIYKRLNVIDSKLTSRQG